MICNRRSGRHILSNLGSFAFMASKSRRALELEVPTCTGNLRESQADSGKAIEDHALVWDSRIHA
jgi:hypothetical protein